MAWARHRSSDGTRPATLAPGNHIFARVGTVPGLCRVSGRGPTLCHHRFVHPLHTSDLLTSCGHLFLICYSYLPHFLLSTTSYKVTIGVDYALKNVEYEGKKIGLQLWWVRLQSSASARGHHQGSEPMYCLALSLRCCTAASPIGLIGAACCPDHMFTRRLGRGVGTSPDTNVSTT